MPRSSIDTARLEAAAAAKELHRDLGVEAKTTAKAGEVDVFGMIAEVGIPLLFKPLDSALGFYLSSPSKGILVTTRRSRHIQRFTAAHELGHAVLGHEGSVDRSVFGMDTWSNGGSTNLQEVAADAFAAELLLPRWLYKHHIRAQGWTIASDLTNPMIVYQLSLRLGASYRATCYGLASHEILSRNKVDNLTAHDVATLKQGLSDGVPRLSGWADVWKLTTRDSGATIVGNPDDLIRLDLEEAASAGYSWNVESLAETGFEVVRDESHFEQTPIRYGARSIRTVFVRPPQQKAIRVALAEEQPWRATPGANSHWEVLLMMFGKETGGYSRVQRQQSLAV